MTITGKFALEENFVQGFKKQMYGRKIFQEFFMFLTNGGKRCRLELFMCECFERNGSAQNGSKTSCKREAYPYLRRRVPYRTVPEPRASAAFVSSILFLSHVRMKRTGQLYKDSFQASLILGSLS